MISQPIASSQFASLGVNCRPDSASSPRASLEIIDGQITTLQLLASLRDLETYLRGFHLFEDYLTPCLILGIGPDPSPEGKCSRFQIVFGAYSYEFDIK